MIFLELIQYSNKNVRKKMQALRKSNKRSEGKQRFIERHDSLCRCFELVILTRYRSTVIERHATFLSPQRK